jgi:hypothetical protein
MSLPLLDASMPDCGAGEGGSGVRAGMGEESNTIGSEVEVPATVECILILDGRLIGESAVVRRLLRSELWDDDESVRVGGRFGSVYRKEEA